MSHLSSSKGFRHLRPISMTSPIGEHVKGLAFVQYKSR